MNVLLLIGGFDGVTYHRLAAPFIKMAREGKINLHVEVNMPQRANEGQLKTLPSHLLSEVYDYDEKGNKLNDKHYRIDPIHLIKESILDDIDVCVFNRNISPTLKPEFAFEVLRKHGIKVVCDMDDSPKVGRKHILSVSHRKMNMDSCILMNCLQSDVIFHTTPQLKKEISDFLKVPKRYVHPKNAIDLEDPQWANYNGKKEDGLFGWAGGVTHYEDLKILAQGYNLSSKPKLRIGGYKDGDREWDRIGKLFEGNEVEFDAPKRIHKYAELLYDLDVVLAPLKDSRFNRCKSELKMLEAAALNKSVIVSGVEPYTNLADNGVNCIVAQNTPKSWAYSIDLMKNKPEMKDRLAERLREDVDKRYNLDNENEKRLKALNEL